MNKTQAIVFFGIVLVGLVISLFTLNKCGKTVEVVEPTVETPAVTQTTTPEKPATTATPAAENPAAPKAPETAPAPAEAKYNSADALLGALSESIKNRDPKQFLEMAGPNAATPLVQAQVSKLIKDPAFALDESRPTAQVAKVAGSFSRWAIRLKKTPDATLPPGAPEIAEIYTDVISKPDLGWLVEKVALPLEVVDFLGEIDMTAVPTPVVDPANPSAPGSPKAPATAPTGDKPAMPAALGVDSADALTVAHAFSKAVVDRNFKLARKMTDTETVSDERVAALLIAVEEGAFKLRQEEPLVVTLNRENIVWVLTRIEAPTDQSNSEFALEMAKMDGDWKINGLAFNALLTALADKAGAGGTAYAPMVKNPQGGESLVVYFDFDNKDVTSRANRQLNIVATILKEDPTRKIRINGHADALGTDQYNKGLSDNRSAAIRKALLDLGVAPQQIITESFGESQPLRPNFKSDGTDDPSGRSQNRRAEVYLDF